ncbi:putative RNA-directed DNA polymerase from transposon BS [Trichonephila inaurata madagascariensis]|uniref:Putative RNA-directed DNA polymerase from transposon BS n=1 Tax=Trichonephila inaurata madagascariensis TaxID=2747483 RepID=A0A8X6XU93_9ARAC|nr:putative RNA-directed DNA polymerase from transposon BS [Trichonephila inaurata madagascariensis]
MLISLYPNYLIPFKIWTPTNHLVQIVSLDISCPTLEFWVGKDCYTSVTCHGKLPRLWKSAIVIPIHKPNKNAGLTTSSCPISLTCITCKLMECMVLRRLTHHLHTNNLMPPEQFAFRKGHSTVDQILYFTQCVRDSQNHKLTRHTMVAFLDVSKAFDRVWKYKLLSKCFGVFGIKGKALPWISNFLNHRNFCVNFHATFSDSYKTYQGIPQGCVLSPTLFSLFISGVEKYVKPSQIGLFADDVVLWCSDANISKLESQLNNVLSKYSGVCRQPQNYFQCFKVYSQPRLIGIFTTTLLSFF